MLRFKMNHENESAKKQQQARGATDPLHFLSVRESEPVAHTPVHLGKPPWTTGRQRESFSKVGGKHLSHIKYNDSQNVQSLIQTVIAVCSYTSRYNAQCVSAIFIKCIPNLGKNLNGCKMY